MMSCERNFDAINTNPNDPVVVPESNVLLSALTSGLSRVHGANMNMTYAGLWAQHYAKIQYNDEDKYIFRSDAINAHWNGLYAGPMYDLVSIIRTSGDDKPNFKAAAMTLKAYYMSVITDCWGDAPYTEAVTGEILAPAYDKRSVIYAGIIQELKEAADMFDADGADIKSFREDGGDIMFDGEPDMWEKLANSLRARLLLRSGDAAGAAAVIAGSPVMDSNDDNAGISFLNDGVNTNPLYENAYIDGRDDHAVSATLVGIMDGSGMFAVADPRLPKYANTNNSGEFKGQANGEPEPADFADISRIGTAFRDDPEARVYIMTYAEVKLIEAEVNTDEAAFKAGIEASFDQYGVSDQAYVDEAVSHFVDGTRDEAIGIQKWIALYGNGVEAWAEQRRSKYPELLESANSSFPGEGIPQRFPYTTTEAATNGTNQDAAWAAQSMINSQDLFAPIKWEE